MIILGGKVLCSEVYSLLTKSPEELHHIEVQTDVNRFTDAFKDGDLGFTGHKLKKALSFAHGEKQRRKRDNMEKQSSCGKSKEHERDPSLGKGEHSELSVLTESFDTLTSADYLRGKTRFPPIYQESKSLLKRKQGERKLETRTKEFLPSLNRMVNLKEKIVRQTKRVDKSLALIHKQGITTMKAPPLSPEFSNSSLPSTLSPEKIDTAFSKASPSILRKKPSRSHDDDLSPLKRRPTPFPSVWSEDRFFMISIGSNVMSEKAKTYIVKEDPE